MAQELSFELLAAIEEAAKAFQADTLARLTAQISRRKLVNTRDLIDSLDADSRTDLSRVVHTLTFAFQQYGRYKDMKTLRWLEQPPVEKILEWVRGKVQRQGLGAFGPDPHPYKEKVKTPERRMNEIAWGYTRQLAKQRVVPQNSSWFQSTFYRGLNALQEEVLLGVADRTTQQMIDSLTERLKRGPTGKYF